mmetsp:Transcript_23061/g.57113  ORF Transcript_23061/g.57113 Transcript_23061/m.57113 type:complete len:230 (-) Transcript_23061:415-1104(-)
MEWLRQWRHGDGNGFGILLLLLRHRLPGGVRCRLGSLRRSVCRRRIGRHRGSVAVGHPPARRANAPHGVSHLPAPPRARRGRGIHVARRGRRRRVAPGRGGARWRLARAVGYAAAAGSCACRCTRRARGGRDGDSAAAGARGCGGYVGEQRVRRRALAAHCHSWPQRRHCRARLAHARRQLRVVFEPNRAVAKQAPQRHRHSGAYHRGHLSCRRRPTRRPPSPPRGRRG